MESFLLCRHCVKHSTNLQKNILSSCVRSAHVQNDDQEAPQAFRGSRQNHEMFWEDTRQIYGKQLPIKRIPAYDAYDPSKGRLTFIERRAMNIESRTTFDKHSAQLYGPRLQKLPPGFALNNDPVPDSRLTPVEFRACDEELVEEDPVIMPAVEDNALESVDVVAQAAAASAAAPSVREAVEIIKPKRVLRVVKQDSDEGKVDWRTAEPYIDEEKIVHLGKQQWQDRHTPFSAATSSHDPFHPNKEQAANSASKPKPEPLFRIVLLKKESDLKSLAHSPLLNQLRPDYEAISDGLSIATPLALQISPMELASLDLKPEQYPSVTTIMDTTMPPDSRMRLENWMRTKIEELGVQGFKAYKQALFNDGKGLHTAVEQVLHGASPQSVKIAPANEGHWKSLRAVFKDISDVIAIEEKIRHPYLCYKGQTDCVISLEGEPAVVEWKTSGTKKNTADALYDNPLQVAAYVGAVNFDPYFDDKKIQIKHGAVVVSYGNGDPASVIRFDLNLLHRYWTQWLRRLQQYWRMAAAERALPQRKRELDFIEKFKKDE